MRHYRIYTMDQTGRILFAQDVRCHDDRGAMTEAQAQAGAYGAEIWQGARLVGRVAGEEAPHREGRSA